MAKRPSPTLTVAEIARRWGITPMTVYRRIRDGHLRAVVPIGKKIGRRVPLAEVERFEREHEQGAA